MKKRAKHHAGRKQAQILLDKTVRRSHIGCGRVVHHNVSLFKKNFNLI